MQIVCAISTKSILGRCKSLIGKLHLGIDVDPCQLGTFLEFIRLRGQVIWLSFRVFRPDILTFIGTIIEILIEELDYFQI